jgi:serine/threonine protein kinase
VAEAATVGNYVLERELGRGGMGAVYAGVHKLVGRRAAIKVLLPDLSRKQDLVERFFNEARAAGRIKHPSIVDIYDFGYAADGSAYIVMELLEGETLAARLKARGPMSIPAATALARQVANALGAAHAQGIVHRDLKPDNVFLVKDPEVAGGERVKLLDFGIAKLASDTAGVSATVTGAILGTPHYMSPEQCEGSRVVDARTDLYSLGCMLFQMLTGQLPFDSPGIGGLIGMHLHVPPPLLRTRLPSASEELEAVIARLLAKPLDERFQSAEAVANALGSPAVSGTLGGVATGTTQPPVAPSLTPVTPATELGMAHTVQTPSSAVTRERDTQARAETVPLTSEGLANIMLRPPSLPVDPDASRPSGKLRPPRGDDPTVPSMPPEMIASQVRVELPPAPASGGMRKQIVIIVSVVVVALGAVLFVNFTGKQRADGDGAGGSDTSGAGGLVGSANGSGTDHFAITPVPDAAVAIDAPPPTTPVDPESFRPQLEAMKGALGRKKFRDVKTGYDALIAATATCGEPCSTIRATGDALMRVATTQASAEARTAVERRVKANDCAGARRAAKTYEGLVDDTAAAQIEDSLKGCKDKTPGDGSGSAGSGSSDGSGSSSGSDGSGGSGSGDPIGDSDNPLLDAFKAGNFAEALVQCAKRKRLGKQARVACAISACKLKRNALLKSYMAGLNANQRSAVNQVCKEDSEVLDGGKPAPPPPAAK